MNEYVAFITDHWILSSLFVILLISYLLVELLYKDNAKQVSPQQAIVLINHQDALILDVRAEEAYIKGHIVGAINLTNSVFKSDKNKFKKYLTKPVIVACSTGKKAKEIAIKLEQQGFSQVLQLTGGIEGWIAAGLPLVK